MGKRLLSSLMSVLNTAKMLSVQALCIFLVFLFVSNNLSAQVETSLTVGGTSRNMIVYAPAGIVKDRPLVISMHGMSQTMNDQKNQTQFMSVANRNNFVLVFPDAINKQWQLWGTADVDFILAIINEMSKQFGIDRDRVYLSGFSMGGMMTYYAATQIADKIAAFAPVSGFLMDGPNTKSSRPIPIIHIHGADDNYVPYANVPTHMAAWASRNGNPVPATVTSPYPANQTDSKSIKYYWGPGKEGVEMVMIGVGGVGHWYSDNPNGIFSSQEIWDFCSKYSLKLGIPKFMDASVLNDDPKKIYVNFSVAINDSINFSGFSVKIDNQPATINSVKLVDPKKLVINIPNDIVNTNQLTLSYSNGNVVSALNKKLASISDTLIDNLLKGAAPRIKNISTNESGDTIKVQFNLKMKNPSDISGFSLNAELNGSQSIPVTKSKVLESDSTILLLSLGNKVYRDDTLSLSYSGASVVSADGGILKSTSSNPIKNIANGLAVHILSGKIEADGITLSSSFSKPMLIKDGQMAYFSVLKNGASTPIKGLAALNDKLVFTLSESIHHDDQITLTYVPGNVKAADNGPLDPINALAITNAVNPPVWINTPRKIEAENFTFKSGMQAENCSDTGGGQNLGYIGNGDWVEYPIENTSDQTDFQISFRVAAQSAGGLIDYYVDGTKGGSISTPSTGNWQVYTSVDASIHIPKGKHYLKIVAKAAGFNFNYFEIRGATGIEDAINSTATVYPNPVSKELTISSVGFQYDKIEILDLGGKLIMRREAKGEPVLRIPIDLPNGAYFVKISKGTQYILNKIVVDNR